MVVVTDFIQSPTLDKLLKLKKEDLLAVGNELNIEVKRSMRKAQILRSIAKDLIECEDYPEDFNESVWEKLPPDPREIESDKVKLARIEAEKVMIEAEQARIAAESKERLAQIELEKFKYQAEIQFKRDSDENRRNDFDLTKHVRLVPQFSESEVEKYFQHFEKIAKNLHWPENVWSTLLQTALKGKAQKTFAALSFDDSSDYDVVKAAILKAYELVPEAYRQKFRNYKKDDKQTYVEFANQTEVYFDRWCSAKKVVSDYEKLRQIVLIEQFKRCVHDDLKTYLDEKNVETLHEMAVLADDYALTHKRSFKPRQGGYSRPGGGSGGFGGNNSGGSGSSGSSSAQASKSSTSPSSNAGNKSDSPSAGTGGSSYGGSRGRGKNAPWSSRLTCHYCKIPGHVMSNCRRKMSDESKASPDVKPEGFVSSVKPVDRTPVVEEITDHFDPKFDVREEYRPFVSVGSVSFVDSLSTPAPVKILRDTGATQTLLLKDTLPFDMSSVTGEYVIVQGVEGGFINVPLHRVNLVSDIVSGSVVVGVMETLPAKGVSMLLGNDLAGGKVIAEPKVVMEPVTSAETEKIEEEIPGVFPSCVVTRAQARKMAEDTRASIDTEDDLIDLSKTFLENKCNNDLSCEDKKNRCPIADVPMSRTQLAAEQRRDSEISLLFDHVLPDDELNKEPVGYFLKNDILMRKWRPSDVPADEDWSVRYQVVVPKAYRSEILHLAHEIPMGGHLGITKTFDTITRHFYWPGIRKDISEFCRTCHPCQIVGKPNQKIPTAPLKPIPAFEEPFSRVIIDCVGPLPKTRSGNSYMLTIMCASTRFPEAIPLRSISSKKVVEALIKFFTMVGLPREIQSEQGSNFTSGVFQQIICQLGATQITSSAYHPESQGALERFHSTLKNMIRNYCFENEKDWDEGVSLLMFAARESIQESLGFSPFELVFGHTVRGPLKLLKESWLQDDPGNVHLLDYVSRFRERLFKVCEMAHANLKSAQIKMKDYYDKGTIPRTFCPGDKVLVLLPISGHPLQARYHGPYEVVKKVNDLNYVVKTPDRRKATQLCHINMIKAYHERGSNKTFLVVKEIRNEDDNVKDNVELKKTVYDVRLCNSEILANLDAKLSHLLSDRKQELSDNILDHRSIFPDVPRQTTAANHDVDVSGASPVKQHAYRLNPYKADIMHKEVVYMLENDIIEPSKSDWSSPCVLVPKPGGAVRFCTDYRKVNALTKTDSYPIPRIDDCIDKIGKAKFITKCDLLKGYWCVPLTERAKEISAFVTPDGLYNYRVMPFGMKNSQATFQRMMNQCLGDLDGVGIYVDDIVIYSDTWEEHMARLCQVFDRLEEARLTVNLSKSEFCQAKVVYLGHVVGCVEVSPVDAKVQAIVRYPAPTSLRGLRRFLGMAGYYRKFCKNFADVALPLTNLLKKKVKFKWDDDCQKAFDKVKSILCTNPVLKAPDFDRPFGLAIDASDHGAGAVLLQTGDDDVEHPVAYFSKKFNIHQKNYSTIEKETLALVLALQHFEVYVSSTYQPLVVYTDHNPFVFLNKMKNKNRRLLNWSLLLQEYNLDVKNIKGVNNVCADALSRV